MKNIPKIPLIIGAVFILSLIVVIASTIVLRKTELMHVDVQLEGKFKDRIDSKFVGSETCKKCHERRYLEWRTSIHSRMMRDAKLDPEIIHGNFKDPSNVRTFEIKDVDYVLGSQWKQQYLKKEGDEITVLPATYNLYKGEWKSYFPDKPKKRKWFYECSGCHVTGLNLEKKTFVEMGVGCEACHGPGGNHAEAVPGFEIMTIISVTRLTSLEAAQICGTCHTRGRDPSGKAAFPADYQHIKGVGNLSFHFNEADTDNGFAEAFWPSGESKYSNQQYLDWKKSQHSKVGVVCITCHGIHKTRTTLTSTQESSNLLDVITSKTKLFGDRLCMSCHTTTAYRSVHRIHTFGSCIACHMPPAATIGEAGDARSHTFQFMFPEASLKAGGLDKQPNSCSYCHHHKDTPIGDLVGFLEAAKKNDMPKPFNVHKGF
jgi:hypothetical protein